MARSAWLLPAILVAALVLRLAGIDWDSGRGLHPDEGNLLRGALALSWPDRLIPEFHAYNDLALWLPKLLAAPFCEAGSEPCLRLAARALSASFSAAAVGVMAAIAGRLAGRGAALATAVTAAFSAPLIQWAHFGTTESALVLLVAALWLLALRWQREETGVRAMALGTALMLGLGFGMKTTAAATAVIPLVTLALAGRPDRTWLTALVWSVPLAALVALAATPSLIFDFPGWIATMRFENAVVEGTTDVFWTRQFGAGSGPLYQLRQLWGATAGAGLLLATAGIVLAPRGAWKGLAPGLGFALVYAGLTFGWHAAFFRYLAPLFPAVMVLAGIGAAALIEGRCGLALRAMAGAGLTLMALAGLNLAASYLARDPRLLAEDALVARAAPGDRVVVEPHDLPQTGALTSHVLPLDGADAGVIAEGLAGADWLMVASRRNWAVLPGVPEAAPYACGYYLALLTGELGYRPVASFHRASPLGPLLAPGLATEETRTVFDRPDVVLLRNEGRLDTATLTARIATPAAPQDCTPGALSALWGRPR